MSKLSKAASAEKLLAVMMYGFYPLVLLWDTKLIIFPSKYSVVNLVIASLALAANALTFVFNRRRINKRKIQQTLRALDKQLY